MPVIRALGMAQSVQTGGVRRVARWMSEDRVEILDKPEAGVKALRGSVIRVGGYGVGVLLGLISAPLLIRHLGIVDFGRYLTVVSVIGLVQGVIGGWRRVTAGVLVVGLVRGWARRGRKARTPRKHTRRGRRGRPPGGRARRGMRFGAPGGGAVGAGAGSALGWYTSNLVRGT